VTYLKAFSTGSCKNICGRVSIDCSCQPNCINSGTCCSDYNDCEVLFRKNLNKKEECELKNDKCELCLDFENPQNNKCGQCKNDLYLKSGKCVSNCEIYERPIKENMICHQNQKCLVDNCYECEGNNPSVCRRCFNGFFLNNNMCINSCPPELRADRMNWMCMEPSVFAWFWIFPSRSSCRNKCDTPMVGDQDCSCRDDCYRTGNCCQDIENYCYQFVLTNN
jgi:hypothetical protein